jgi:hypothetical protein
VDHYLEAVVDLQVVVLVEAVVDLQVVVLVAVEVLVVLEQFQIYQFVVIQL